MSEQASLRNIKDREYKYYLLQEAKKEKVGNKKKGQEDYFLYSFLVLANENSHQASLEP